MEVYPVIVQFYGDFPHPSPPPEGEGGKVSLREFHVNGGLVKQLAN